MDEPQVMKYFLRLTLLTSRSYDIGDLHQAADVIAFSLSQFVENEPDGLVKLGNDNVL